MVGVWAVLVVLCLAGQAHTQLGEVEEAQQGDERTLRPSESDDGHARKEEAWAAGTEEVVVMLRTPRSWRPLQDTYLGCLKQDNFTDSIVYVNLTEVMEVNSLGSVEEACYHFCVNKVPFAVYLTISPALNGSVDACGCHLDDELNLDNMVEDEGCDHKMDFYRVYCGPYNIQCFSRAGRPGAPSLPILALALLLALLSGLADVGPISPTYFGFNR